MTGYICGHGSHRMNRKFQYGINKLFKKKNKTAVVTDIRMFVNDWI